MRVPTRMTTAWLASGVVRTNRGDWPVFWRATAQSRPKASSEARSIPGPRSCRGQRAALRMATHLAVRSDFIEVGRAKRLWCKLRKR